jgi:hypothetical protein
MGADGSAMHSMIVLDRTIMEADLELDSVHGYDESKIVITVEENS